MKNIAILSCLKSNRVCAGVACLKALNERRAAFAGYQDEPLTLTAFLRCTQCGADPEQDPGMMEKLERIVSCKTQVAHIGKCCQRACRSSRDTWQSDFSDIRRPRSWPK